MKNKKRLKLACYTANISMAVVANLSPLLFLTFRSSYGISFSLLGLLVVINFCTQLGVDLFFSFSAHKVSSSAAVKITPFLTILGFIIYALAPVIFPHNIYIGLVLGTVVFSASSGLSEVLISPVIAAIPSDNPDREMSKLHSVYAWGAVAIVIISTLLLMVFGKEQWQWLVLLWTLVPVISAALFFGAEIPDLGGEASEGRAISLLKNPKFLLCFFCIFFGAASENTMAQWSSGYMENALHIPKVWGDIFGVAMFAMMLGIGRTYYAKRGKNIHKVLFFGAISASVCYLVVAVSSIPIMGLAACAFTGFCVSMLWPGNLIAASGRFPQGGVILFALMAAGGDLGGAIGPQCVGVITDLAMKSEFVLTRAASFGLTAEQLGMKIGMLSAVFFPAMGAVLLGILWKASRKKQVSE